MTDILFSSGGFFSGVARVMDLWGAFDEYNASSSPEEADTIAIYSDWRAIGEDLNLAMGKAAEEEFSLKSE